MLTALVLLLKPASSATVPAFLGRQVHAWFLHQVQQVDPGLAQRLHQPNFPRPFTASPLWCLSSRPRQGSLELCPTDTCCVRITSLVADLSSCLLETLSSQWAGATVEVAGVTFRVRRVASSRRDHPQAAHVSYRALTNRALRDPPPDHVTFRFVTPTTFRRSPPLDGPFGGTAHDLPLPVPELLFGGLLRLWNAFAPRPLPDDLQDFARDCVVVSRYDLHTELVAFGSGRRGRVGGFVGKCRFALRCPDPARRRRIGLLGSFAPFAGAGWRTAMGLGQVQHQEDAIL
jgi:CRISPR-associated endoribonuclease Cas6